jgi:hypothetical protein
MMQILMPTTLLSDGAVANLRALSTNALQNGMT